MPSYSGIQQKDVLGALCKALEMLETHPTGPLLQAHIASLREPDSALAGASKLGRIAKACTDQELFSAVQASGVEDFLARLRPVIQYHALNDTDGNGRKVYSGLKAWPAAGPAAIPASAIEEEADAWLFSRYIRRIIAYQDTAPLIKNYAHAGADYNALDARDRIIGKARMMNAVHLAERFPEDDRPVIDFYLSHDERRRSLMLQSARIASGLDPAPEKLSPATEQPLSVQPIIVIQKKDPPSAPSHAF